METSSAQILQPQLLELNGVSWAYYEHTLDQIGNRRLRVSFLDGNIEIMSPLPEHDAIKSAIGQLIEMYTFERGIDRKSFGSATFKSEKKQAGTEPDECYYFRDLDTVKGMKRFDPAIYPAPNLAIEVDVFSSSFPRESIYGRLGVGEIWRYKRDCLEVRLLQADGSYATSEKSGLFPSLPLAKFTEFIKPMVEEREIPVLRRFCEWVRSLPID